MSLDIENALACPFCGQFPEVEPWHGGGPLKHMVSCTNDACHCGPATTGPTKRKAIDRWNVRANLPAQRAEVEPRSAAALHACEGLDTVDLAKNDKGWLAEVVHGAARVEGELTRALRARCPGNGDGDDDSVCECQSYEAGEQGEPCPPGCCVMAEEKDVRAILEAIERDERDDGPSKP